MYDYTLIKYETQNRDSADWVVQDCYFCQVKYLTQYVEYNQQKERQIKECLRLDARKSWSCRWLRGSRLRSIRSGHVFDCWWRSCHSRQHWEEVLNCICPYRNIQPRSVRNIPDREGFDFFGYKQRCWYSRRHWKGNTLACQQTFRSSTRLLMQCI